MIVIVIMILRIVPVIDAEIVLARDRHVVMRDGVEEPACCDTPPARDR